MNPANIKVIKKNYTDVFNIFSFSLYLFVLNEISFINETDKCSCAVRC